MWAVALIVVVLVVGYLVFGRRGASTEPEASGAPSAGPKTATLVLRDTFWDELSVDGVSKEWKAAQGPRGFSLVPPGRHRIACKLPGGDAVLDLVTYPGEIIVRRLEVDHACWVTDDPDTEKEYQGMARRGALAPALVPFPSSVSAELPRADSGELASGAIQLLQSLAERAGQGEDTRTVVDEAQRYGEKLIGVLLVPKQLDAITQALDLLVSQLAMNTASQSLTGKGNGVHRPAATLALAGAALFPGSPPVSEIVASVLCDVGMADVALPLIEAALARDVFDAEGRRRARATHAEALAHLSRLDEAEGIVTDILDTNPDDTNAQRVRTLIEELRAHEA